MHDGTVPPAARHLGTDGVPAFAQQGRHVVRGVEDGFLHLGSAGLEFVVEGLAVLVGLTHALAVDEDIIDTQSRCVEAGATNCRTQLEDFTEHRHAGDDAAVLLHESLAAAHGCLHVALAAAAEVADVGSVEGIAGALEVLAEGHGATACLVIDGHSDIVEVRFLTLVARSADAHAEVAHGKHPLRVLESIDQHIIYIGAHVGCLAFQHDVVLPSQEVCLAEGRDGCVAVSQVPVVIDVAAHDGLADVQRIDGPHHVGLACCGAEADAGIVLNKGEVVLHIEAHRLGHCSLPGVGGRAAHVELPALEGAGSEHAGAAIEVFPQKHLVSAPDDEIVKVSLFGLVAVVVVFAEAELAVGEVARPGVDEHSVDIRAGSPLVCHLDGKGVLFAVLETYARDGILREAGRIAAAPAMRTEAEAAIRVNLPHVVVAVVGSGEDEAGGKLLHVELHLHFVVGWRYVLSPLG